MEAGRLTNRRILVQRQDHGTVILAAAFLEDVSACWVGRQRPRWWRILFLCVVGSILMYIGANNHACRRRCEDDYSLPERCKNACTQGDAVAYVSGAFFVLVAIFIYLLRKTTVTFMVDGNDDKFELVITSRAEAMDLIRRYFNMKEEVRNDASVGIRHDPGVIPHPRQQASLHHEPPQPLGQQGQKMQVTVPAGMSGGQSLQVETPSGKMAVAIPNGLQAGQTFQFLLPAGHTHAASEEAQGARAAAATLTV